MASVYYWRASRSIGFQVIINMNYFVVIRDKETANIVNPKGQIFCSVYMGDGVYETLTERRAQYIANLLNKEREEENLTANRK